MRVRVEVVETRLRTFDIEGVDEETAKEIVSQLYADFATEGVSPEFGKNSGFAFQIRSASKRPPGLRWTLCDDCDGNGLIECYITLGRKKRRYSHCCCSCDGKGVIPADSKLKEAENENEVLS